jgi:hypothetical protein
MSEDGGWTHSPWQGQIRDYFTATNIFGIFVIFGVYVVSKIFYRLYLSPLSRIPGPKLAGMFELPIVLQDHSLSLAVQSRFGE